MKSTLCRACGAPLTRSFVDLGMSPLANSFVPLDRAEEGETFYPLHAKVCEACHLVQLAEFEEPRKIFSDDYAYFSSFSASWLTHAERYCAAMTARFGLAADAHVAEVASNDGYLLQYFARDGKRVTGIEPAANCAAAAEARGVHTEILFFGTETGREIAARRGQASLIAANNVLAHVPDIHDFLGGFRELLLPEGVATFEFPHLLSLMRHNQFDTIYHEHFSYLALGPITKVLAAQRLRMFDVERLTTHGGSLRLFVCHAGAAHVQTPAVAALAAEEHAEGLDDLARYDAFAPKVVAIKCAVLDFLIAARREGKTVAAYGAAAKGNTLLNYCGIGPDFIAFAVDRNPVKQNTLLPGTRIPVFGVEAVAERKPDYLMILPWNLRDEVAQQMSGIRDWGGRFVTAIPQVEVF
ncbi:class I SAM-dependent methyltransferase [Plastoroseomonas arctica]|uniref:Class I SAM-dependent methyltransferase n=1 Tax=Plastoroseomonas arctica TaxID=1509237 RepID=A0AAF1K2G3_9PROT|nr:class I SAM-dependent methyltransferase [Plastoroseomonas arctica]MBR0655593.1 class I SAM-dependent methyltransferase [Plastoroseomonas arctica]